MFPIELDQDIIDYFGLESVLSNFNISKMTPPPTSATEGRILNALINEIEEIVKELMKRAGKLLTQLKYFITGVLQAKGHIKLHIPGRVLSEYNKIIGLFKDRVQTFTEASRKTQGMVQKFVAKRKVNRGEYNQVKESCNQMKFDVSSLNAEVDKFAALLTKDTNSSTVEVPVSRFTNTKYVLDIIIKQLEEIQASLKWGEKVNNTGEMNDSENKVYETLMTYYRFASKAISTSYSCGSRITKMTSEIIKRGSRSKF